MKLFTRPSIILASAVTYLFTALSVFANEIPIKPGPQDGSGSPILAPFAPDLNSIVSFVITLLGIIAVLAALLWLILGAIKWITSGGDKEKVSAARQQIIAAIVGLIIVILSFVILNFVLALLIPGANIFDLKLKPLSEAIKG